MEIEEPAVEIEGRSSVEADLLDTVERELKEVEQALYRLDHVASIDEGGLYIHG